MLCKKAPVQRVSFRNPSVMSAVVMMSAVVTVGIMLYPRGPDNVHANLLFNVLQYDDWNSSGYQLDEARQAAKASMDSQSPEEWVDRFGNEPRKGADIVVQCLEREGAHRVFAYPGGASMEIHQALTRSNLVKNTLCRHEQVCFWLAVPMRLWACAASSCL